MYKLIRFYNQNRKAIWKFILIIALIIATIQLINYFIAKNSNNQGNKTISQDNNIDDINRDLNSVYVSDDKSQISGKEINETVLKENVEIIDEFFNKCNDMDLEGAYNMLSDNCKEQLYFDINSFEEKYYLKIFNGNKKSISIEPWTGKIYKVTIKEDMLSTGKNSNEGAYRDYVTIEENNSQYKLNINSYIGKEKINKESTDEDIDIKVLEKDIFMDYEIYTFEVYNNTGKEVLLDRNLNVGSIYLQDEKELRYEAYNTELTELQLRVESQNKKKIKIKFYNQFATSRKIDKIIFSDVVLDYNEYKDFLNKNMYKTSQINVDI